MLPDSTTTIGDGDAVITERDFQSMNAVERTSAKLSACVRGARYAVVREDSMAAAMAATEQHDCRR